MNKKFSLIYDGPAEVITCFSHQNDIPKAIVHIGTKSKQVVGHGGGDLSSLSQAVAWCCPRCMHLVIQLLQADYGPARPF